MQPVRCSRRVLKIALVGFPRRLAVPGVLLGAADEDTGIRGIRIGRDGLLAPGEGLVVSQAWNLDS